jgi:RNA recognition motif-containing protein
MNNKLFVGNLDYNVSESELQALFSEFGAVTSCSIAKDRDTGRPRGFAFVEMESQAGAEAAIRGLNGREVGQRQMSVAISQPKPRTGSRGRY